AEPTCLLGWGEAPLVVCGESSDDYLWGRLQPAADFSRLSPGPSTPDKGGLKPARRLKACPTGICTARIILNQHDALHQCGDEGYSPGLARADTEDDRAGRPAREDIAIVRDARIHVVNGRDGRVQVETAAVLRDLGVWKLEQNIAERLVDF